MNFQYLCCCSLSSRHLFNYFEKFFNLSSRRTYNSLEQKQTFVFFFLFLFSWFISVTYYAAIYEYTLFWLEIYDLILCHDNSLLFRHDFGEVFVVALLIIIWHSINLKWITMAFSVFYTNMNDISFFVNRSAGKSGILVVSMFRDEILRLSLLISLF